jgi:hypothetical protein
MATGTIKLRCNCRNVYQDEKYGNSVRVHNVCDTDTARCTSCSKLHPYVSGQREKKKGKK